MVLGDTRYEACCPIRTGFVSGQEPGLRCLLVTALVVPQSSIVLLRRPPAEVYSTGVLYEARRGRYRMHHSVLANIW